MLINSVNHKKNVKFQPMNRRPKIQAKWILPIVDVLAKIMIGKSKLKVEKFGMEEIEKSNEPFLLFSTHHQFLDFCIAHKIYRDKRISYICHIDGFDKPKDWLLRQGGTFPIRRLTGEVSNIKNILHSVRNNKTPVGIYPEARYSVVGTTAPIPDSYAKLVKLLKIPVAVLHMRGNYLTKPQWKRDSNKANREIPLYSTVTQIISKEEIATLSIDEINKRVRESLNYNEWKYWQDSGFKITHPQRANGIHRILYKCPHCNVEFQTRSGGAKVWCTKCDVTYELTEDGFLECKTENTKPKFKDVPDWVEWQRNEVRTEIKNGTYSFEAEMDISSMPRGITIVPLGKANFKHDLNGFNITGHYNGEDYQLIKSPKEMYTTVIEFCHIRFKQRSILDISFKNDTFYLMPKDETCLLKIQLASEEIYKLEMLK